MTKVYQVEGRKNISIKLPKQTNLEYINIEANSCIKDNTILGLPQSFKNKGLEI